MEKNENFEQILKELELTVAELEKGDVSLDEAISLFEKGIELSNLCSEKLENAKQKITKLTELE